MPQSSIRRIAEYTGINRGSVFESLKQLVAVGLVTYVEAGERRKYSARDPEVLHEIINEKRRALFSMHAQIEQYSHSLELDRLEPGALNFASFYDGDEGLANILRDVLTTARRDGYTEYYSISSPRVSEYLYNKFPHFSRERDKLGLKVRILGLGTPLQKELPSVTRKLLPHQHADSGVYTLIYGNKIALVTIDERKHTSGIVIDNEGIANLQRLLFEYTWNQIDNN